MKKSLEYVLEKARAAEKTIIVGAGTRGKELLKNLSGYEDISVWAFFDNDTNLIGQSIDDVEIMKPCKVEGDIVVYVIAVDSPEARRVLCFQLEGLGVERENIITYYFYRDYDYKSRLDESCYEDEIKQMYYETFGKKINWLNPITYNEKINWEKLNVKDERRTRLADKFLVREWIKNQIGEKYLTELYGVWNDASEIDFDKLPDRFALKLNNGSGRNVIVKDKKTIDPFKIRQRLKVWEKNNFAFESFELHYRDIVPKIICEEYLEGVAESVYDYNIFCFHGEPMYIWCIKRSHRPGCQASFYNKDWEMQPFSYGYPKDPVPAPKPNKLDEMLELSRILCKEFPHVRVDWYNLPDGRLLFGEMTFSTWSGLKHFEPEEYDLLFGKLIG